MTTTSPPPAPLEQRRILNPYNDTSRTASASHPAMVHTPPSSAPSSTPSSITVSAPSTSTSIGSIADPGHASVSVSPPKHVRFDPALELAPPTPTPTLPSDSPPSSHSPIPADFLPQAQSPSTIRCVALVDRPAEVGDLISANPVLVGMIQRSLGGFGSQAWRDLRDLLLASRDAIPDPAWIHALSQRIPPAPWASVKLMLGYYGEDAPVSDADGPALTTASAPASVSPDEKTDPFPQGYSVERESVILRAIRADHRRLEQLPVRHPSFFRSLRLMFREGPSPHATTCDDHGYLWNGQRPPRERLPSDIVEASAQVDDAVGDESMVRDLPYDAFMDVLRASRDEFADHEWEEGLRETMAPWPHIWTALIALLAEEADLLSEHGFLRRDDPDRLVDVYRI